MGRNPQCSSLAGEPASHLPGQRSGGPVRPGNYPAYPAAVGGSLALPLPPIPPRSALPAGLRLRPAPDPGSSPLARGTQRRGLRYRGFWRFIPARVGNTLEVNRQIVHSSVHPRSRGEHMTAARKIHADNGSSPLARGTLFGRIQIKWITRFIPARAGNTRPRYRPPPDPAVHPRSRGEHHDWQKGTIEEDGSSPLARGTRQQHEIPARQQRFIPARAGNTSSGRRR